MRSRITILATLLLNGDGGYVWLSWQSKSDAGCRVQLQDVAVSEHCELHRGSLDQDR